MSLNPVKTTVSALLVGAIFAAALFASETETARIAGVISYVGEVPRQRLPDNAGIRRELLSVHRRSGGLQSVLVYLTGDNLPEAPPPVEEDGDADPIVLDQHDETFVPHLIAIRDGESIRVTNNDNANHNVRTATFDRRNEFNVYTGPEAEYEHTFYAGERLRPIRLGCDIHGWMRAWIYVFDHPWFAVTDEKGEFEIADIPPGEYTLIIRQPDVGLIHEQQVTVTAGESLTIDEEFTPDGLDLPE